MGKTARDILADRIEKWAGDDGVYDYADRLLKDLDIAGFEIIPESEGDKLVAVLRKILDESHWWCMKGQVDDRGTHGCTCPKQSRDKLIRAALKEWGERYG